MRRGFDVLVGVVIVFGCQRDVESPPSQILELTTDEQRFLLVEHLPFGLSYKEVKERLPALREIHPDGHSEQQGRQGLFEASAPMSAFGRDASLECNFGKEGLFSYYFWLTDLTPAEATTYQSALRTFYVRRYGPSRRQPGGAEYWFQPSYRVILRRFSFGTGDVLQWGYEQR